MSTTSKIRQGTKIFVVNLLVLAILCIPLELIFGGWLQPENDMDNLNIIRDKTFKDNISGVYESPDSIITYSRDKYGLRGHSYSSPAEIDILTIGGSTTDQRCISDGLTWQDVLEKELTKNGHNLKVANAGVDGQSTFGHIKNFQMWFPHIPDLKPKYILFYIGINDMYRKAETPVFDVMALDQNMVVKNKSAIYNLLRKIRGTYFAWKHDLSYRGLDLNQYEYTYQEKNASLNDADFQARCAAYRQRIEMLITLTAKMGAQPVFVTQPTMKYKVEPDGRVKGIMKKEDFFGHKIAGVDYYYQLSRMNKEIYKVAAAHGLSVIELTSLSIWEKEDFYDFYHMTPRGASKVGKLIADGMMNILQKDTMPFHISSIDQYYR